MLWWRAGSPDRRYEAIVCDGAIRSGKTFAMTLGFFLWAMSEFSGRRFALCGRTVGALRRNVLADTLPALRALASEIGGVEPFLRSALCLEVFRDRGLLTMEREGDAVTLVLQRDRRASLDDAPLVAALKQSMERGGGTL